MVKLYGEKKMKKQNPKQFIEDLLKVYKKHGLSLSHEDTHGSFIVEQLNDTNIQWLKEAYDKAI